MREVRALIDELSSNGGKDILKRLGFPNQTRLDLSKLIVGGHSFGGMTSI